MNIKTSHGFTLVELMITVAIISILAAIAYPNYIEHVQKGKRAECRSGVMQVMQQQERYFSQFNRYQTATFSVNGAAVKTFSGDGPGASACNINSVTCSSNTSTTACIEVRALPANYTDSQGISYFGLDSTGVRSCSVSGTTATTSLEQVKKCWP